jgi:nucleoid-associated protein YgaU
MIKATSWVAHKVKPTDTLDALALSYYNNPTYWWVIAYFNDIQDAFIKLSDHFEILKIPAINGIEFGDLR